MTRNVQFHLNALMYRWDSCSCRLWPWGAFWPTDSFMSGSFPSVASRDPQHGLGEYERFIVSWRESFDTAVERAINRGDEVPKFPPNRFLP